MTDWLALDAYALAEAERRAAAQPRCDATIPQLPSMTNPSNLDLLPIYDRSSGIDKSVKVGDLVPSSNPNTTFVCVNVKNYGALGDGVTDDTAAIVLALAAAVTAAAIAGVTLYFPPGIYNLASAGNGTLAISTNGVYVLGNGRAASVILLPPNVAGLSWTGTTSGGASGLSIKHSSNSTAQSSIAGSGATNLAFFDILVSKANVAYEFNNSGNARLLRCDASQAATCSAGVWVHNSASGTQDIFATECVLNGTGGGVGILLGQTAGGSFDECSAENYATGLSITPSGSNGTDDYSFEQCRFNGNATNGIAITPSGTANVTNVRFNACSTNGAAAGAGFLVSPGATALVQTLLIGEHIAQNNFLDGLKLLAGGSGTLSHVVISGGAYNSNVAAGIDISGLVSTVLLSGCDCKGTGGGFSTVQVDGVHLVGNPPMVEIIGCNTRGNSRGTGHSGIYYGNDVTTLGTLCRFTENVGFNPQGSVTAPSVPASTVQQANIYPFRVVVYISGGTVSAVTIFGPNDAGGCVTGRTAGTFDLDPDESISWTGSGAPTWVWKGC